ncbi:DUF7144 family membrane protein [Actinomadura livida]|uniref:DUF7144 domain-containing protein n=1 Tax=Actinomadura livida TaxID=79909 RepID=A0A7W7N0P4_9ACTN|nr:MULTISPECIES: hypothetical protein [Actinomadura]MBB4778236.1 hypothetical protein [Actinomadura catellatispora]GGU29739.1 hypothetical protein GCM10010208_63260 [Actinomadura livida]
MTTKTTHPSTSGSTQARLTSGWLTFAGTIALVVGTFNIIAGLVALLDDEYYLVGQNQILVFDYTTWGWFWLALGIFQVAVGAGIVAGRMWARVVGVIGAVLAAIGHLAFLQAFPIWSVLTIALCVLLIYALTAPPAGSRAA